MNIISIFGYLMGDRIPNCFITHTEKGFICTNYYILLTTKTIMCYKQSIFLVYKLIRLRYFQRPILELILLSFKTERQKTNQKLGEIQEETNEKNHRVTVSSPKNDTAGQSLALEVHQMTKISV